jgi:chemotaxis protein MotB
VGAPDKKKHAHVDHHGGGSHEEHGGEEGWLISYADMMTLLVGFFVILLSFSSVDQEEFEQAKQSITKEFGGQYEIPFGDEADRLKEALKKQGVGDQVSIKTHESGIDIAFQGTTFFESGSADLKKEAQNLFNAITPEIKNSKENFDIIIEGHTDDVPLVGGGAIRNNFELSSIRACRVLDVFVVFGFNSKNMTAVGYGESRPVVPNRDANGIAIPTNQAQNRRVVIKLVKPQKSSL